MTTYLICDRTVAQSRFCFGQQHITTSPALGRQALLPEPKILFLDESTVGLDRQVRRDLWDLIPRLKREGITILLTASNFFILPMAFFSGTFFPANEMPCLLKGIIYILPLTHTNQLMRMATSSARAFLPLGVLCGIAIVSFVTGALLIKRYNE
jgi:hypothetical protein